MVTKGIALKEVIMTKQEAERVATEQRRKSGSGWPAAQDLGGSQWGLAWSATDLSVGEVLRRRSLGLPDYPTASFDLNFLEIRESDG